VTSLVHGALSSDPDTRVGRTARWPAVVLPMFWGRRGRRVPSGVYVRVGGRAWFASLTPWKAARRAR
jgi:hypothetical protein